MLFEYYETLFRFQETLKAFRSWNCIWKASVLTAIEPATDVDFHASKQAAEVWEKLEATHSHLAVLHKRLGIPAALPELPIDEWEERVVPLAAQESEHDENEEKHD